MHYKDYSVTDADFYCIHPSQSNQVLSQGTTADYVMLRTGVSVCVHLGGVINKQRLSEVEEHLDKLEMKETEQQTEIHQGGWRMVHLFSSCSFIWMSSS